MKDREHQGARLVRVFPLPLSGEVRKEDKAMVDRMLKAYLRGDRLFKHKGKVYPVPEEWEVEMDTPGGTVRIPVKAYRELVEQYMEEQYPEER